MARYPANEAKMPTRMAIPTLAAPGSGTHHVTTSGTTMRMATRARNRWSVLIAFVTRSTVRCALPPPRPAAVADSACSLVRTALAPPRPAAVAERGTDRGGGWLGSGGSLTTARSPDEPAARPSSRLRWCRLRSSPVPARTPTSRPAPTDRSHRRDMILGGRSSVCPRRRASRSVNSSHRSRMPRPV
jgi:hypothetical protein